MLPTGERVVPGAFVVVRTPLERKLGIGKLVRISGARGVVTYFDVPGETQPFQVDVLLEDVRVVALPEQTRVFRCDELTGRWQVGRIINGRGPICQVAFPNGVTANVARTDLHVRWRKPIASPIEFLRRQITETPLFATARSNFMRSYTLQYSACSGMSTLLSSIIELERYQYNVVTRVLQDPVQRYLLADEVGLGKTIEAGLIVRQYILDCDDANVLVIVPPSLVTQWRQELGERFCLSNLLDDRILVIPSTDLNEIKEHLASAGMLVVDEVHHLSRLSSKGTHPLYELLRQHAAGVQRLLLLSGTPVLADTAGFLRILHLLDPVVFPLNDLEGFEKRLQSRQLVAEIAANLAPEDRLMMERDLDRLCVAFGDDPSLMSRIDVLRPIVRALPEEDDPKFLAALNDLREHLSETYKLHRRILRNRRKAVPYATLTRGGLEQLHYTCRVRAERQRVIDDLRVHLVNSQKASVVARSLFSCAVHFHCGTSMEDAVLASGVADTRALALAQQIDGLTTRADDEGTRQQVTRDAVQRSLANRNAQIVIFCDKASTAESLTNTLRKDLRGITEVQKHSVSDETWRRFLTEPLRNRVLVCDAQAEEGLNLHGGQKIAIHYDVPDTPNRIEQRLGRLSRYGRGEQVRSLTPVCESDPNEMAWVSCLDQGLNVFSDSISSLQYVVEETLRNAIQEWFFEGVDGLDRWKQHLSGPKGWAALERRRIDQQDILDAMGESRSSGFKKLEGVDAEWSTWSVAFLAFARDVLQFNLRNEEWEERLLAGECVFRLNYVRNSPRQSLLTSSEIREYFANTFDKDSRHATPNSRLTYPYAFARRTVLSKKGRARALRMLRCGDPLVESLRAFCEADDRGRIFAMWRHRPDYVARDASGCDLWFRFDYLVQANPDDGHDAESGALARRVEQHFQRQFYTVWVEATGEVTMSPPKEISEAYRGDELSRDFNLNLDRWEALRSRDDVPWLMGWHQHCDWAVDRAFRYLAGHETLRQHREKALGSVQLHHTRRRAQHGSRLARLTGTALAEERRAFEDEQRSHNYLIEAISSPEIRADSAGAVFISSTTPFLR
jgi:ATP-dependent helicase HepA